MNKRQSRAFTLVESLVMLIIVAICLMVSIPLFLTAMSDGRKKDCRANMMAIANAEEQYKIKISGHTYTTNLTNLVGDYPVVPICPNGGAYTVTISDGTATAQSGAVVPVGQLVVSCSASGDGKLAPTIDSQ